MLNSFEIRGHHFDISLVVVKCHDLYEEVQAAAFELTALESKLRDSAEKRVKKLTELVKNKKINAKEIEQTNLEYEKFVQDSIKKKEGLRHIILKNKEMIINKIIEKNDLGITVEWIDDNFSPDDKNEFLLRCIHPEIYKTAEIKPDTKSEGVKKK